MKLSCGDGYHGLTAHRKNGRVSVTLAPALLLCTLLTKGTSDGLRTAAHFFACLTALSPRNLWEEFVLRTIILRSHITVSSPLSTSPNTASAASEPSTPTPSLASSSTMHRLGPLRAILLRSVFEVFSGARTHPDMRRKRARIAAPLSNVVLKYPRQEPPTPESLATEPAFMQHLFVSESATEPGVDALIFLCEGSGTDVNKEHLIAVGIQCKWSKLTASTELSLLELTSAENSFRLTMMAQGWREDQLMLIFLAHRPVVSTAFNDEKLVNILPNNIAVAGLESGLEEWLGPSLIPLARCVHAAHLSHGPYSSYVPGQGPPSYSV